MKGIVTAVHQDGAKWGWPRTAVFRYRGEDGSWAWVPQNTGESLDVGDVVDVGDGWEWLPEAERAVKLAELAQKSTAQRKLALVREAQKQDRLELRHAKKTAAQLDREIAEALGVFRRRKKP